MKYLLYLLMSVCFSVQTMAQPDFKGILLNKETGQPVEGATVSAAAYQTIVSDAQGSFIIYNKKNILNLPLSVTTIGYTDLDTTLTAGNVYTLYLTPRSLLLQAVEVKALRAGDNAPFAKTNLSKTFIEKNNLGQDLPFILGQTPNVVASSDAGNGIGYTGIRIRGTDATRINMTINGIPYNDAESQGLFLVNLPDFASSVSSIQIQRGVGTSSNGAGAFGASVNFSTNEYNDKRQIELNNTYGSFNTWKNTLKISSGLLGKHITIDGRISNITSNGYIDRATTSLQSAYASMGYWEGKNTLRFNVILGKEKTYQAWNGVPETMLKTHRTYNSAGTEKPGKPYDNETDNYKQSHYQLFWNRIINKNWILNTAAFYTKGSGYYEQYKADKTLSDYGLQPIIVGTDTIKKTDLVRRLWLDNDFYGQTFSIQQKTDNQQLTIGGAWNNYRGKHFGEVLWTKENPRIYNKYYDLTAYKTDVNFYVKWQRQIIQNVSLFTDLQYRYVHYTINGFRDNPGLKVNVRYNFVNPKAGISYQNKDWSGFISYGMGNKEPNRDDFETGVYQQPKREQLNDIEFNISKKNIFKNLNISTSLYYMSYKDQLVLTGKVNDVGAYTRSNIAASYRLGTELELHYRQKIWNASYSISLSSNKVKNFTEYIDNYDNGSQEMFLHRTTDIAFSPSIVQSFVVNLLPLSNIELTWMGKHVGKQYLDNTSSAARQLDAYLTNDLRINYSLPCKQTKNIQLILQINNILDARYVANGYVYSSYKTGGQYYHDNNYFPMAGRNFLLALHLKI